MNYLRSFLDEKKRGEKAQAPTDKTDKTAFVSFVGTCPARSHKNFPSDSQKSARLASRACPPPDDVTPDSRHPLIPSGVRAKIEKVEAEARQLGWPAELLWNNGYWDRPRGLAAVLAADDEVLEVTPE